MRSPRSIFALVAVAALASVFSLTVFAGTVGAEKISARGDSRIPPEGCPPGWEQATHPLNPQLGCLPTQETAGGGGEESDPWGTGGSGHDPDECPPGWVKAVPPLNPALGCIPDTIVAESGPDFVIDPPVGCPEGTVPATPPLNPELGCVPGTIVFEADPEYAVIDPTIGCPEGWVPLPPGSSFDCISGYFATNGALDEDDSDLGGPDTVVFQPCPDGWEKATPPLNRELGCVPDTLVAAS